MTLVWFAPALYFYMRIPLVIDLTDPALPTWRSTPGWPCCWPWPPWFRPCSWRCPGAWPPTCFWTSRSYSAVLDALRTSRRLTRGQRGRIFLLWLSFLPLCILGLGSFGIGFLWIQPYFHTAMGEVYLELSGQRAKPEAPEPEAAEPSPGSA